MSLMNQFSRHRCIIYDGPPSVHLAPVAATVMERLRTNHRCLYLNSPPMVAGLRTHLAAAGIDLNETVSRGALVLSSNQDHLIDGEFDADRMLTLLADAVAQAIADGYDGLWASGDMLWEFGSERNLAKLLAYEVGLEELFEAQPALCGICQYHRDLLPVSAIQVALYAHPTIYVNETLSRLNPHYRQVAVLRDASDDAGATASAILDGLRRV
jgi:hypothetical protein